MSAPGGSAASTPGGDERLGARVLGLVRPSGWRRLRLFAASPRAPRVRRRVDAVALLSALLALVGVLPTARAFSEAETALVGLLASLPSLVDPLAVAVYDLLLAWSVVVAVLALVRRHLRLVASMLVAVASAVVLIVVVNGVLGVDAIADRVALGTGRAGAPLQLVIGLATVSVAAREMSQPFRTFGRRLAWAGAFGALALPVAAPLDVVVAALTALAAVAAARLAIGSPISTVSSDDVAEGLIDLGVDAVPDERWGLGVHEAIAADGRRLAVEVLGRDEWDTQLLVSFWQFVWYRADGRRFALSPRLRVEYQAYLLLLAAARGAPVTSVVAAGTSRTGDAFLVTEVRGVPLDELPGDRIDDDLLRAAWEALFALHDAGISHRGIDGGALEVDAAGGVAFGRFELAQPIAQLGNVHADRAQLLTATALVVGTERAVAAALGALADHDPDGVEALVAYLQTAAIAPDLRDELDAAEVAITELRTATAAAAGIDVPELPQLWRVSWRSVVRLAAIGLVGYLVIQQLAGIGWDTILDALQSANPAILAVALVFGQVPRLAGAASLRAASPAPVPLERVARLQFAITFINLAVPSTAARVAVSIRFFQRSGATASAALSAGALDSVAGFVVQLSLIGGLLLAGVGVFGVDLLPDGGELDLLPLVLVAMGVVVVVGLVVALVPKAREWLHQLDQARKEATAALRSPATVVRLLGWNLLAELLFSTTIWIVLAAFGQQVGLGEVVLINVAVALFAGLVPVPGGVGVTEAALTAGFVAVGVDEAIAFSAALCYRLCTFYLPPLWGYVALRSLRNDGFL